MNEGTISGIVHEILPVKQITEKFSQQEIILHLQHEKYPQYISLVTKEIPFAGNVGDEITAKYWLRGRLYEKDGKKMYFNSIYVHDYAVVKAAEVSRHATYFSPTETEEDELPF